MTVLVVLFQVVQILLHEIIIQMHVLMMVLGIQQIIEGCTDCSACNYDSTDEITDDDSCTY